MAKTRFTGPVQSDNGFIFGVAGRTPLTVATLQLTARNSGYTTLISYAGAGGIITLPAANIKDAIGLTFYFQMAVNVANPYKIKTFTNAPGDLFVGGIYAAASGGAATLFIPNGTTNDVMNLGGANGGQVGSRLTIQCTALNRWEVSGDLIASAAPSTPFADA